LHVYPTHHLLLLFTTSYFLTPLHCPLSPRAEVMVHLFQVRHLNRSYDLLIHALVSPSLVVSTQFNPCWFQHLPLYLMALIPAPGAEVTVHLFLLSHLNRSHHLFWLHHLRHQMMDPLMSTASLLLLLIPVSISFHFHVGNQIGLPIHLLGQAFCITNPSMVLWSSQMCHALHVVRIIKNLLSISKFTRDNTNLIDFHPLFSVSSRTGAARQFFFKLRKFLTSCTPFLLLYLKHM
jgi:hypothetical protein